MSISTVERIYSQHYLRLILRFIVHCIKSSDTCYQLFPTENAFCPEPLYFHFTSAVAASLHTAVSRLQGAGFLQVFLASKNFRENLIAVTSTRSLIAKFESELTHEDLQNNRLRQNLITLGNFTSFLYAGLVIALFASAGFVADVCTCHRIHRKRVRKITPVMSLT